ncbi:hypothetical protein C8F04DRAFT_1115737 [Mycena alexandri]|uniref:Uncharacterized protein n=1 Tax=Mycena alexandri TaxID=1745969 RepID=A0AAD6SM96_9AGAR|nr:hypothetical protein C8F04DRAFT_1115737 [Mycena alexandri]
MVAAHMEQLEGGLTPEQVKFSTSVPVLRNASVKPIVDLYNWAQTSVGKDLIKRAWEKCSVGEFNFGEECLTSKKTKAPYRDYLREHPDFRKDIEDKIGDVLGLDDAGAGEETEAIQVAAMGDDDVFTDDINDTEVPLERVIQDALQVELAPANLPSGSRYCIPAGKVLVHENGGLIGGGATEDIWAYNDNGVPWSAGNLADEAFGTE